MFDNMEFSVSVALILLAAALILAVFTRRQVRLLVKYRHNQDAKELGPYQYDDTKWTLAFSVALSVVLLSSAWMTARGDYVERVEAEALEVMTLQQRDALQDDLGLSDWTRDNASFHTTEFDSGQIVVRAEGCRIRVNFLTNSEGNYAVVVGSGVPEGDAQPIELPDGSFRLHSPEECQQIARDWAG